MLKSYKSYSEYLKESLNISEKGSWMRDYDYDAYYDGLSKLFQTFKEKIKLVCDACREQLGVEETYTMRDGNSGYRGACIVFDKTSADLIETNPSKRKAYYNLITHFKNEFDKYGIEVGDHYTSVNIYIRDSTIDNLSK